MRLKKNPEADLNNKSSFYFSIGLFLVLLVSWQAIEYKNYDDDGMDILRLTLMMTMMKKFQLRNN